MTGSLLGSLARQHDRRLSAAGSTVTLLFAALLLVLISACSPGSSPAEPTTETKSEGVPPLLPLELFFEDPRYSAARLSPDGEQIAFMSPHRGARNIWIKGVDEPLEAARPVTAYPRSVPSFFWSRDGRALLYLQDRDGDENYRIYALDPRAPTAASNGDGSGNGDGDSSGSGSGDRRSHDDSDSDGSPTAAETLPPSWRVAGGDGVRAFIYHLPRQQPDVLFVGLNERDPRFHDVYRVDIASGERELIARNDDQIEGWHFHEGELRKAVRTTATGGTEILAVTEDGFERVYHCEFEESCRLSRFHPDGQRFYLRTNAGADRDITELVLFDPQSGKSERVHVDPKGEVDLGHALFSEVDDRLLATFYEGDKQRIYPHDEAFAAQLEWLRAELGSDNLHWTSRTADERLWTVARSSDVDPGTVYLADVEAHELTQLYASRPNLPSEDLAPMVPIRYKARDGVEIPAYLTLPPGHEPRNLPLIVNPHGGPWLRDTWGYRGTVQFLANRGYAVLQPNFRGSAGYGKAFLNAGNREWGTGTMQHDITDGVKHLIEEGIADPERIAIYGGSYGGFAALAGLAFTPELYAAGISVVGPSNIITLVETFPPYWKPGLQRWQRRVGNPDDPEDRQRLKAQSPLFSVDQMRAPLLVVHGANDPRVKQQESDQIVAALRDAGHPVEYLLAPDEGHGFVDELNRLAYLAAAEQFLAKHIGGRTQQEHSAATRERLAQLRVDIETVESQQELEGP
ncbi:S9 family peptidase [Halorhodospira abdelmalekii]|nr:S9 family peptidase [Halorhodospira abdelmalekii]